MMEIEGIKFSAKEIEGTDLESVKKFCQKNKVKAACIVYVDKDDNIEMEGIFFNSKARDVLNNWFLNKDK